MYAKKKKNNNMIKSPLRIDQKFYYFLLHHYICLFASKASRETFFLGKNKLSVTIFI